MGCAVWVVVCVLEREGDGEREMIQEKCDLGEVVRERRGSDQGDERIGRRGREAAGFRKAKGGLRGSLGRPRVCTDSRQT